MSDHILGIEIGSSNIKIIEVSRKGAMLDVHKFAMIETPEDSINNGVITNADVLRKVIGEELVSRKFTAKKVACVIQSSSIIIRNVVMDKQSDKIIKEILAMKLEEYLPIEKSQYQVDYKIAREFREEDKEKYELALVAAPNSIIMPLAALMKSLKLVPIMINIASEAVGNVFGGPRRLVYEASENVVVLDIGGHSSNATIVSEGQAILNRYIDFGVEQINQLIEEAQHRQSILDKKISEEEVFEIVRPQIEYNIISEVERILQFYYSNYSNGVIKKVYLVGGGATIKGIRSYVRDALNIPTEKLTEFNSVSEAPGADFEGYKRFCINILGAINGIDPKDKEKIKGINLLPNEYIVEQKVSFYQKIALVVAAVEVVCFVAFVAVPPKRELTRTQNELQQKKEQLKSDKYAGVNKTLNDLETAKADIKNWMNAYDEIKIRDFINSEMLDELTMQVPEGMTITKMSIEDVQQLKNGCKTEKLEIEGHAEYFDQIIGYMGILETLFPSEAIGYETSYDEKIQKQTCKITVELSTVVEVPNEEVADADGENADDESIDGEVDVATSSESEEGDN